MGWSDDQVQEFKKLLAEQGEDQIRENAEMGAYGRRYGLKLVEEHLRSLEAAKEDARRWAEEANRIARDANRTAAEANWLAKWAIVIFLLGVHRRRIRLSPPEPV